MAMQYLLVTFPEQRVVLADGTGVGLTNHTMLLPGDEYEITLEGAGCEPASQQIALAGTSIVKPLVIAFTPSAGMARGMPPAAGTVRSMPPAAAEAAAPMAAAPRQRKPQPRKTAGAKSGGPAAKTAAAQAGGRAAKPPVADRAEPAAAKRSAKAKKDA